MTIEEQSLLERMLRRVSSLLQQYRLPLLSCFFAGLLAHFYAFTNQLPNHDGVSYLFGKGMTVSSGRWGLELLRPLIPDFSMPWLHGICSLLLLSVAVCLILRLFAIRNPLSQLLLPALIVSFPSQTGVFCYMFTSSCYAVSFLLAVLGVACVRGRGWRKICSVPCLVLSVSIYQAYIALAASLMLLLLVKDLLDAGEKSVFRPVFFRGLFCLLVLGLSLWLYWLSIPAALKLWNIPINEYANEALYLGPSLPEGILAAYRMFFFNLTSRYNMLIVSRFSRALHAGAFLLAAIGVADHQRRAKNLGNFCLLVLCLLLLPAAVCCLYLRLEWGRIHTLVLYSFISLYVLVFLGIEHLPFRLKNAGRDLCCLLLCLVTCINIFYANRCYAKLELEYEQAYSLATTVMTQVRSLPGFHRDLKLAFYPSAGYYLQLPTEFEAEGTDLAGTEPLLMGVPYALAMGGQNDGAFFYHFIDAGMRYASGAEALSLMQTEEAQAMPCYPAPGSIRIIGDYVLVKYTELY